ncbi:MAG: hypothetical protein EOP53_10805, partial [Sphingobacteriales bacterium]
MRLLKNALVFKHNIIKQMNQLIIPFHTILLFSIMPVFLSCSSRNHAVAEDKKEITTSVKIGDTVSALDKSIYCIFQDSKNNFWFASNVEGIYRYDGKTLLYFTTKHGLCNKIVRDIKEDKSGNIFFSTQQGGICKFDGEKFTTLPVSKSNAPEKDWKLEPDDLWFKGETGKNGPYRWDGKTLYHLEFPKHFLSDEYYAKYPNTAWSPYEIYNIYQDHKGNVWFGTGSFGVCRYDGKSLSWLYEDHLTHIAGGGTFGIRSILEDKNGQFWFSNTSYRYDMSDSISTLKDRTLINYKKETGIADFKAPDGKSMIYFLSAVEDNFGNMWMVTYEQGVWKYDEKTMTNYPIKNEGNDVKLFTVYTDHKDDLWLGTDGAGAY